ncbi:MAG TPA: hypothetical protein VMU30_07470, partial [Bacteroidota bacterium]|nr:hypothetical protein [Bacteroidota bacterium]
MKNVLLGIFLIFVFPRIAISKRKPDPPMTYDAYISVGYGSTVPSGVSDLYNSYINNYQSLGVPVQNQIKYGPTAILNSGLLFSIVDDIYLGMTFDYFYSPAYSNYQDSFGSLKINGTLQSYDITMKFRYVPDYIGKFPVMLNFQAGACHTYLSTMQEIQFTTLPINTNNLKMNCDGWGPTFQLTIGTA